MTTVEEWRPVVGFERYEVSDQGRVRSLDHVFVNRNGTSKTYRGRLLAQSRSGLTGHLTVGVSGLTRPVHHLVLDAFVGPRPDGMEACHGNGDPADNRLSNLRWDSRSENVLDQVRHGVHNNASKTHCKRRHSLTAPNLISSALRYGRRNCLACASARSYLKNHPEAGDMQTVSDRYYAVICGTDMKKVS